MKKIGKVAFGVAIININIIPETGRISLIDWYFSKYFRVCYDQKSKVKVIFCRMKNNIAVYERISINKSGLIDSDNMLQIITEAAADNNSKTAWKDLETYWQSSYIKFPEKLEKEMLKLKDIYFINNRVKISNALRDAASEHEDVKTPAIKLLSSIYRELLDFYNENLYDFFLKEFPNIILMHGNYDFDLELETSINHIYPDGKEIEISHPIFSQLKVNKKGGKGVTELHDYMTDLCNYLVHIKTSYLQTMPVAFSNNPNEPTLNFFDLNIFATEEKIETPAWDEFLTKYTPDGGEILKTFIRSIYDAKNNGRQCLYILDHGGSGKSTLLRVLGMVLGKELVGNIQKDSLSNQFGFAKVWNKRLVIIPDNKNSKIFHSEKIHMILGNDDADIEYKGEQSFNFKLNSKMIICSNTEPDIQWYAQHEKTRVIILKPVLTSDILNKIAQKKDGKVQLDNNGQPILLGDNTFEDKLFKEFPAFFSTCKAAYNKLCPTNSNIELPIEMINELAIYSSPEEDEFEELYSNLNHDKNGYIKAADLQVYFESKTRQGKDYRNFVTWLSKAKHISKSSKTIDDGSRKMVYIGISINNTLINKTYEKVGSNGQLF